LLNYLIFLRYGVYAFIIEGTAKIAGQTLEKRDGFGI